MTGQRHATILSGWGYWDITHYPHGGCFRRAYKDIPCLVPLGDPVKLAHGSPREFRATIAPGDHGCSCEKLHVAAVDPRALKFEEQ